jgi:hypothetical protein
MHVKNIIFYFEPEKNNEWEFQIVIYGIKQSRKVLRNKLTISSSPTILKMELMSSSETLNPPTHLQGIIS